jgi:hypothetical protein
MIRHISATLFLILRWIPFTGRAVTLLAVLAFFFAGPIRLQSDVILSVVAFCLAALVAVTWLLTVAGFYRTQRTLTVTISAEPSIKPDPETPIGALIAGEQTILRVELARARLLPFFTLDIELTWRPALAEVPLFNLTSMWNSPQTIAEYPIVIPHRGVWTISTIRATLTGPLKLTRIRWKVKHKPAYSWNVALRLPYSISLPLLASSSEPGGEVLDNNNRLGDYYDLKPYHPSDGMSRVVWKILAKSGQLISRQPEPTSTPEGELLMFLVARPTDDEIAAIALKYLIAARQNNIAFRFGCLGMQNLDGQSTVEKSYALIIESAVRATFENMDAEYSSFITSALTSKRYQSVNIFCSEESFSKESLIKPLRQIALLTERQNLTPTFFIPSSRNEIPAPPTPSRLEQLAVGYRLIAPSKSSNQRLEPVLLPSFETECISKGWGLRKDRGVV